MTPLEVILGCMFSGKSTKVIRRALALRKGGDRVRVIGSAVDTRSPVDSLVSREGDSITCTRVLVLSPSFFEGVDVVVIDEAQFFDGLVKFCRQARESGVRVVVSGLDLDASGNPFGEMLDLTKEPGADVSLMTARCGCGNTAEYSQCLKNTATVGGVGQYEPRCVECFEPLEEVCGSPMDEDGVTFTVE